MTNWATPANGASVFSVSSTYNPGGNPYVSTNIIDGNDATPWVSNANPVTGINAIIDLGSARSVAAARVLEQGHEDQWDLGYSSSSSGPWTVVASGMGPVDVKVDLAAPVSARYWRLIYTASDGTGNGLYALELLDTVFTRTAPVDWARDINGGVVSVSSTWSTNKARQVIDGDDNTVWVSNDNALSGNTWAQIRFGGVVPTITAVRVKNSVYTNTWKVQSSPNGSAWTDQMTGSGPNDTTTTLAAPVTQPYWRLVYMTGSSGNQLNVLELLGAGAPAAFPAVATESSGATLTGNSVTVNLPSGIVAGDIVVIFFVCGYDTCTIGFPAGWTVSDMQNTTSPNRPHLLVARRVCDGSEGASISVSRSGGDGREGMAYIAHRITGGASVAVSAGTQGDSSTGANPASLNPAWGVKNVLWYAVRANEYPNTGGAIPSGYGNLEEVLAFFDGGSSYSDASSSLSVTRRQLAAATEDPGIFASYSKRWCAFTVAVEPGGAGSGGGGGGARSSIVIT